MSETKDKPKGHSVKEKEGRGGEWSVVGGFKILNVKICWYKVKNSHRH